MHAGTVPRGGGLALWSGYVLWVLLFSPADHFFSPVIGTTVTVVFFVGYLDDLYRLPAAARLVVHLGAAALVVFPMESELWVSLLGMIWIAGLTSAYNMIDGLNGLCLLLSTGSFLLAVLLGAIELPLLVAGLCLGLLVWNYPVAKTFIGDGGSTLLGFLWGACMFTLMQSSLCSLSLGKLVILLFLLGGIPALDTAISIVRRARKRQSPFHPDREHLHHRLLSRGIPLPAVLLILIFIHTAMLFSGIYFILII
ncbi:MAG: undecaprenyl/decaprenyl-phosphate alpha-N-acetylglucosaminyl 1-phosphate transferase [Synergistales bacterium]|nr:undecaprenyl/decaprenyl-phosphate alpha-N-acetylglucosaminyl 1-phosphate transferase [Synergistales bacterium]